MIYQFQRCKMKLICPKSKLNEIKQYIFKPFFLSVGNEKFLQSQNLHLNAILNFKSTFIKPSCWNFHWLCFSFPRNFLVYFLPSIFFFLLHCLSHFIRSTNCLFKFNLLAQGNESCFLLSVLIQSNQLFSPFACLLIGSCKSLWEVLTICVNILGNQ